MRHDSTKVSRSQPWWKVIFFLCLAVGTWWLLFGVTPILRVYRALAPAIEPTLEFRIGPDQELDCFADDCYVVNLSPNVYHINVQTGKIRTLYSDKRGFHHLSLSPDGQKLYLSSPGSIGVLSSPDPKPNLKAIYVYPDKWKGEGAKLQAVGSSELEFIWGASTARTYWGSAHVKVANLAQDRTVQSLHGGPGTSVFAILRSDDNCIVAQIDSSSDLTWTEVYRAKDIRSFSWSPTGISLAGSEGILLGQGFQSLRKVDHPRGVLDFPVTPKALALSPRGRLAVALMDGLSVRELSGRWGLRRMNSHPRSIRWIDENTLIVVDDMGYVQVFRI